MVRRAPLHSRAPPPLRHLPYTPAVRTLLLVLAVALGGCATTKANPYATFAAAGASYASSLKEVLDVAERTGIDATSWRLLDNDTLTNTTPESYAELAAIDAQRAEVLQLLRHHADTLSRYFGALSQLAGTTAPGTMAEGLGAIHGAIDTAFTDTKAIGDLLRGNVVFPPAEAVEGTARVIIGKTVSQTLKKELEARAEAIAVEIATHEAILAAVAQTIDHDLAISASVAERVFVLNPLLAEEPVANPTEWVEQRRALLEAERSMGEVRAARAAARALRESFEALTAGAPTKSATSKDAP